MILVRHILDQGYAKGSLMETVHHIGYRYRNVPLAIFLMEEELKEEELWTEAREMVEWFVALEGIWDPKAETSDMDAANTRSIQRLGACLFKDTPAEQVQYLKGLKRYVETWIKPYPRLGEGMKTDYTGFHHNFYYAARYVHPAYNSFSYVIFSLKNTVFEINDDNQEILKKALLAGRVSGGGKDLPISLAGRGSILTNLGSLISASKFMAQASDPVDERMAGLYNRFYPGSFPNVPEETFPHGFWQFNFSPLGVYRQDDWVANMKGFNTNFLGSEIYEDAGRYARYYGYGAVEVFYEGGFEASGRRENGWDWNIIPGTTTIHLPFEKLKAEKARQDETTLSEFAGALRFGDKGSYYITGEPKLEGTSGIYAMNFRQKEISSTHNPSFTFRKSMFCIDGKVICLGTGISNNDTINSTCTNLFQTFLNSENTDVLVNGLSQTGFPYSEVLNSENANWLIDATGTGFLVEKGAPLVVRKKFQTSPDQSGNGQITSGNFATTFINHGTSPSNASYEFVIVPHATKETMQSLEHDKDDFYRVLQKNNQAHILQHVDWQAHVLFEESSQLDSGRICSNSKSCLVISDVPTGTDQLKVAVCDPSMTFPNDGNALSKEVELGMKGIWLLETHQENVEITGYAPNKTLLKIKLNQGEPTDFVLKPNDLKVAYAKVFHDAFMQGITGYNSALIRVETGRRDGYLMFDLTDAGDSISSLQLQLGCTNLTGNGQIAVYLGQTNHWTESNLSEINKPERGVLLGVLDTTFNTGQIYFWNLDASKWMKRDTISLIVKQLSGTSVVFASKENTISELTPRLMVVSQNSAETSGIQKGSVKDFLVYPNPFSNEITIETKDKIKQIAIFDISGKMIQSNSVKNSDDRKIVFSMEKDLLLPGIYFLRLIGEGKTYRIKVLKVK